MNFVIEKPGNEKVSVESATRSAVPDHGVLGRSRATLSGLQCQNEEVKLRFSDCKTGCSWYADVSRKAKGRFGSLRPCLSICPARRCDNRKLESSRSVAWRETEDDAASPLSQ